MEVVGLEGLFDGSPMNAQRVDERMDAVRWTRHIQEFTGEVLQGAREGVDEAADLRAALDVARPTEVLFECGLKPRVDHRPANALQDFSTFCGEVDPFLASISPTRAVIGSADDETESLEGDQHAADGGARDS